MLHFKAKFRRFIRSLHRVLKTHYPRFLLGRPLKEGDIPIFVYHDIETKSFTRDLMFLRNNGYQTLTTKEFIGCNERKRDGRMALLTFDDARRNFWQEAFPLLMEFNMKATLFVPTRWIRGQNDTFKNEASPKGNSFMTWDQLRICVRSGLIDVQSHGHRHALVYTSPRLVTFASALDLESVDLFDWPMRHEYGSDVLGCPPLGTPIYSAAPLLSTDLRMVEDEAIAHACQDAVRKNGEKEFFSKPNWMDHLLRIHKDMNDRGHKHKFITQKQLMDLVRSEFHLAKEIFIRELENSPCYFAFPWMLGSDISMKYAAEFGIEALFGVGLDYYRIKDQKGPLPAFYRIKGDWLRFLPGKGRQKWGDVLPEKMRSFLFSQHLAH